MLNHSTTLGFVTVTCRLYVQVILLISTVGVTLIPSPPPIAKFWREHCFG